MNKNFFIIIFSCLFFGILSSCKDDSFTSNSSYKLSFSTDTLSFDTVFTNLITPTKKIMVYNKTSENIRISTVRLDSDKNYFQINVNGKSGCLFHDIELQSKDSLYIFVQLKIDELGQNAPLHILDSLVFQYNGNQQNIKLHTYGQDVHLLKKTRITKNTQWTNDKPYLVYDTLIIEKDVLLTIDAGTKIYFHNNATMLVEGSVNILGDFKNPVIFRGDRTDNLFSDLPYDRLSGQWNGIRFSKESTSNQINGTIIRNGNFGIWMDSAEIQEDTPRLILSNSEIHNVKQIALKAIGSNIYVYNSIISNGTNSCVLLEGGEYIFNHCTIANYSKSNRINCALVLANHEQFSDKLIPLTKAEFNNCIIYGTYQQEIKTDNLNGNLTSEADFNYKFQSCLIKYNITENNGIPTNTEAFQNMIWNEEPRFKTINNNLYIYDFQIDSLSPAINKGNPDIISSNIECSYDKIGFSRISDEGPDIGAYEWQKTNISNP